jgi:muramoyltetrapeptide carboxypeptidase
LGFSAGNLPDEPGALGFLSAPDNVRLAFIKRGMRLKRSSALLAVRGGYGAMRILPSLHRLWGLFPPKPLIGFSDISALHLSRLAATGVGGWHAPNLTTLSSIGKFDAERVFARLTGEDRSPWVFDSHSVVNRGQATGPLLGGNLSLFSQLYGSPFCPKTHGAILLFEDIDERPYEVDRMLTGLRLRGAFQGPAALIFGSFTAKDGDSSESMGEVLTSFGKTLRIPVLLSAPFGHGGANSPWYYAQLGRLTAGARGGMLHFL